MNIINFYDHFIIFEDQIMSIIQNYCQLYKFAFKSF